MAWVKAFHIIFVVSWYAGLLYLPRLFVYHADCEDEPGNARFKIMERRLFGIMTVGAVGAAVFGFWLLYEYAWAAWSTSSWMHAKLALVAALAAYHVWCYLVLGTFRDDRNQRSVPCGRGSPGCPKRLPCLRRPCSRGHRPRP